MAITVVFETHAISEDNELGVASGWNHSRLSERGRRQARELGERRSDDGIATVFSSDLRRAVETADIAFGSGATPILLDWRLREATTANGTAIRPKRTDAIQLRTSTSRSRAGRAGGRRSPASAASSMTSRLDGTELESSSSATSRRGGASITTSAAFRSRTSSTRSSSGGRDGSTASREPTTSDATRAGAMSSHVLRRLMENH